MKKCLIVLWLWTVPVLFADRPNILFIYTDDQSHRTVGCDPRSFDWVTTPNIDQLAAQGIRFDRAYIGTWCMPSRATLLTGHHQHGIESMRMEGQYPGSVYDPEKCPFWPSVFRKHGYHTAHIGKWHTGVDDGYGRDWDFQQVWNRPAFPKNAPNYFDNQLIVTNGGEPVMHKGYTTDNYTDMAISHLKDLARNKRKTSWYLWVCYGAVHGPFTPADRHLDRYASIDVPPAPDIYPPRKGKPKYVNEMHFWEKGKGGEPVERAARKGGKTPVGMKDSPGRLLTDWVRQYHQGVLAIDEGVGRLLEALVETGFDANTWVVFTSDQGFAWGQHGFKSKVGPYDGTIRAPLIVRPPSGDASAPRGSVVTSPVSGVDLPPTFFAWAGIDLPWKMHGRDMTPLLMSRNAKWDHPALVVHTAKQYGSATSKVPGPEDPRLYHGPGVPWYVSLNDQRYKYIRTLVPGEVEELYDLENDPDEIHNLAQTGGHKKRVLAMRKATIAELKRTGAKMAENLPEVAPLQ